MPMRRWILPTFAFLLLAGAVARAASPGDAAFFEQRIRPVLVEHCQECHSAESKKLKGGLRLDTRSGLRHGGDTRAAVVPGDTARSLLLDAIGYRNADLQMPPKGRLPDAVIADFTAWIAAGAVDPRDEAASASTPAPTKAQSATNHWAFQPIANSPVPASGADRSGHPVDRFLQVRLKQEGLAISPAADRRTLIRRATYDLTGLPPTPEEVAAFLADTGPDPFGRMIDRLLASPRYGERWGRWWLDLARYADTNGQDENKVMANAWRYRDWVIRAFNENLPFDQFITHQLAGDLLPTNGVPQAEVFRRWTATGFLVLGPKMLAEQDKPKLVMDLVDEQIDVTTRAFLGLTVGCARCHDHKFDPIPTRDYYALAGIFKSTRTMANLGFVSKFNERPVATSDDLARIEAAKAHAAAAQKAVDDALERGHDLLHREASELFPRLLAGVASSNRPAGLTPRWTNAFTRLQTLWNRDPAADPVSRELHRLVSNPIRLQAFAAWPPAPIPGRIESMPMPVPGRVGGAFEATGKNSLELPHSDPLEPAQLTVEVWVRAPEFPKTGDARRWLVSKNANEEVEGHYALMLDAGRAGAMLNIGGGREHEYAVWSADGLLKPGKWHHLAFTYDSSMLRLFVDGTPAGETAVNRPRVPGQGPLVLGRRADRFIHFKGRLDEARVYSRALSADALKHHFEHPEAVGTDPSTAAKEPVVARWEFNEIAPEQREPLEFATARETLWENPQLFGIPKEPRSEFSAALRDELTALERTRDAAKAEVSDVAPLALAVEDDKPVDLPVHVRGSHLNLARDPVPRGFIRVASARNTLSPPPDRSGRLELARWLTDDTHPLTSRVIVNRLWQAHFGDGLVRSSDNFGLRGDAPTHPELLDWLATQFRASGWDVKRMHRLLLTSDAWKQGGAGAVSSSVRETALQHDPENRLLWHFPRQRLEAEMVRDALLAVSGRLDAAMGGTLVNWKNDDYAPEDKVSATSTRRSVYLPIVRDRVFDVFTLFDFANPSVGTARRIPTVVSHQALFFLNSPLVKESAQSWSRQLAASAPSNPADRIARAYAQAFGRPPTAAETARALEFIRSMSSRSESAAWTAWCQMLFAANEFVYRE